MVPVVGLLLVFAFLFSIGGLFLLIWSISTGQFSMGPKAAEVIFDEDEVGHPEEPAATRRQSEDLLHALTASERYPSPSAKEDDKEPMLRAALDDAARKPVLALLLSSVVWLLLGSVIGLIVSYKLHSPDTLTQSELLTFGRLRPLHLSLVVYGWVSMAGMGVALWLTGRILKTPLHRPRWASAGCLLWNVGLAAGSIALLAGWTDGVEWLEFPWQLDVFFVVGGACIGVPILTTIRRREARHLYVSIWYIGASFVWFPFLFAVANWPKLHFGVQHGVVNWWFAHNVLGLWITPLGLAAAYYFIPKVLGKPIHSYQLSLLGFWALALFYSQVGLHHLIGGPVPVWLVTLSVVTSVMMIVPVVAVAINHHMTTVGHFRALRFSPTLAFVVTGAVMYTLVSLQGSLHSFRTLNAVMHFTHATVAHAHFGVYGFASFVMFGSFYFILPRLARWEWPYPWLIRAHFWLAVLGIVIYVVCLSVGGFLQARKLLDGNEPFMQSVVVTIPYLIARTVGGAMMTVSHFIFAFHVGALVLRHGPRRSEAPLAYVPARLGQQGAGR